jgi:hypothetical protein
MLAATAAAEDWAGRLRARGRRAPPPELPAATTWRMSA